MEGRAVKTQAMAELFIQRDKYQVVRHKPNIQKNIDTDDRDVQTQTET